MKDLMKARPSPAMVVALIALFVSLSGTAAALSGSDTVQSDDLGPGAQVTAPDVAANAVDGPDVTNNSLTGADVNEASLDATLLRTRVAQGGCAPAVAGTGAMVKVGPVCIDKYEASVWSSPTGGTQYGVYIRQLPLQRQRPELHQHLRPERRRGQALAPSSPGSRPSRRSPTPASACRRTPSGRWRSPARRTRPPAT